MRTTVSSSGTVSELKYFSCMSDVREDDERRGSGRILDAVDVVPNSYTRGHRHWTQTLEYAYGTVTEVIVLARRQSLFWRTASLQS